MIEFSFTEEQEMIRQSVREFVQRELKPAAARIDAEGRIPKELIERGKELGLFGLPFPEEYGGGGAGEIGYFVMCEELSRGCNSYTGMIGAHVSIAAMSIWLAGSEEQKRRYIPPMARGEKIGCYALTEPGAGSDAANIQTTAVRRNGNWYLNGQKVWITNADIADVFVVYAVTDRQKRAHGGITAFIVERDFGGVRVGAVDEKMGLRGMHSPEVWFEDCPVPDENVLGPVGEGFKVAMRALDHGRLSLGACCVGAAKEMLELSILYAKQRHTFGKPLIEHQLIQAHLAEMAKRIYAMESMVYRSAWLYEQGVRTTLESAIVKWYCTEELTNVIDRAMQIHGGMGYMSELPIERYYRDTRVFRIFEGANEIQQLVIARELARRERW